MARTAAIQGAAVLLVSALLGSSTSTWVANRLLLSEAILAEIPSVAADIHDSPAEDASSDRREDRLQTALLAKREQQRSARDRQIVEHNRFCPACTQPQPAPAPASGAPANPQAGLPETSLPLALLATMVSDDPLASMATIHDTQLQRTGIYTVGERLREDVVVAGIERGKVVLRASNALEQLPIAKPEPPKRKKGKRKPKQGKRKPKKGKREIDGAREAIDCQGNACTVDRRFVDKLLANPAPLMRQAKVLPAVEDGKTQGFRLFRVRRGTLPQLLGLRNGDTLLSVNGTKLDSMDRAIGLYNKLRRASDLSFTYTRKGKVHEKHIAIR